MPLLRAVVEVNEILAERVELEADALTAEVA
jgi:hypothetical protein